jgi:hypothetical protein
VDVLAVLRKASGHYWSTDDEFEGDAVNMDCALAAVAELVAAAQEREAAHREVIEAIPPGSECGVPSHIRARYRAACGRFDAAIAAFGEQA